LEQSTSPSIANKEEIKTNTQEEDEIGRRKKRREQKNDLLISMYIGLSSHHRIVGDHRRLDLLASDREKGLISS